MKKFTALLLAAMIFFILTGCTENKQGEKPRGKVYLPSAAAVGKSLDERKAYLRQAFDHSRYNKAALTRVLKKDSPLAKDDTEGTVADGYLFSTAEDGTHLYYKNYGDDFVFMGKYSFALDMYSYGGYDPGDRFIMYYRGNLPRDGDISSMDMITLIPEYSLVGSKAVPPEQGEKLVDFLSQGIDRYLDGQDNPAYAYMSIEEAVLKVMEDEGIDPSGFYRRYTGYGGVYYTDGEKSFTATAVPAVFDGQQVIFTYTVYGYDGIPARDNEKTIHNILFEK